jgi:hypothetical protein
LPPAFQLAYSPVVFSCRQYGDKENNHEWGIRVIRRASGNIFFVSAHCKISGISVEKLKSGQKKPTREGVGRGRVAVD